MPMAVPTMPFSASGVSNTRSSPNSACRPSVARNTPPALPTSSPMTITRGFSRRATASASRTACTMVSSAMAAHDLLDDLAGGAALDERQPHHASAPRLDHVLADDGVLGVVRSFDEHVGLEAAHQLGGSVLVEEHHGVDHGERGEHTRTVGFGKQRPAFAFESPRRGVGVEAHDEGIAESAGTLE